MERSHRSSARILPKWKRGITLPLGILIEITGPELEEDIEGVIERRIHEYTNYIEGFMHLNQRYDIWVRVAKKSLCPGIYVACDIGKLSLHSLKRTAYHRTDGKATFFTDKESISAPATPRQKRLTGHGTPGHVD